MPQQSLTAYTTTSTDNTESTDTHTHTEPDPEPSVEIDINTRFDDGLEIMQRRDHTGKITNRKIQVLMRNRKDEGPITDVLTIHQNGDCSHEIHPGDKHISEPDVTIENRDHCERLLSMIEWVFEPATREWAREALDGKAPKWVPSRV